MALGEMSERVPSFPGQLERIWVESQPQLLQLAAVLGLPLQDAEDTIQEVYVVAAEQAPQHLADDHLKRWLLKVLANRCLLYHRRRKRWWKLWEKLRDRWVTAQSPPASVAVIDDEQRERIRSAIDQLSPLRRTILVLRYYQMLNSSEIGEVLGLPAATVRDHLRCARHELAKRFRQDGQEDWS